MQEMHFVFMSVAVYTSRFSQYSAGSLILSTPLAHMHCMWGVWLQRVGVRISNSCYIVELWVSPTWLSEKHSYMRKQKEMLQPDTEHVPSGMGCWFWWFTMAVLCICVSAVHNLRNTFNWLAVCTCMWMWQRQGSAAGLLQWLNVPAN